MRRLTNMRMPWWLVDIGMYTSSDILMEFITSVRPRKAILTHCCFLEICIVSPVCTYERQIHIRYWHVAQLDRAQRYGRWCCRFDSCRVSFPIYLSWQRVITARITLDESRWFESSYRNCILYKNASKGIWCSGITRHFDCLEPSSSLGIPVAEWRSLVISSGSYPEDRWFKSTFCY